MESLRVVADKNISAGEELTFKYIITGGKIANKI